MIQYKSKHLSTIATAMKRCQHWDETLLDSIVAEVMKRDVVEFIGEN